MILLQDCSMTIDREDGQYWVTWRDYMPPNLRYQYVFADIQAAMEYLTQLSGCSVNYWGLHPDTRPKMEVAQ